MMVKKKIRLKKSVGASNSSTTEPTILSNGNFTTSRQLSCDADYESTYNTNNNGKHKTYRRLSSEPDGRDKGESKSTFFTRAGKHKGKRGEVISPTAKKRGSVELWNSPEFTIPTSPRRKLSSNSEWDENMRFPAEYVLPAVVDNTRRSSAHRVSYRKAIQKAGYNMNELCSTAGSASPLTSRKAPLVLTEVDWSEVAVPDHHIWAHTNASGDFCYVGEKDCQKSGPRKKCSACHIVVHEQCLPLLHMIGFRCKTTFREATTRSMRESLVVHHHWVHRRKQEGKCKQCGKSFEKRFQFREATKIVAISCSWCKEAYHNKVSCFEMHKINEPCTLGNFSKSIVPSTWIIKPSQNKKSVRGRSKKKKNPTGTWRKRSSKDNKPKTFIVRPLSQQAAFVCPTLIFINPKSGGKQGSKLMQVFQWHMNPRQICDLSNGGPQEALELYRKVPNLRILACGGDGTVGWILSVLDKLNMSKPPPVAILPLGTGNDLSRTLNFGPGYTDEPIHKIIQGVEEAKLVKLDRWKLIVEKNEDTTRLDEEDGNFLSTSSNDAACDGVDKLPLDIINNYFSIGSDAQVSLSFHESRESHPAKFNSRFSNKMFYARASVNEYLTRQSKDLSKHIRVECDGIDITHRIRELKPVCVLFLNIPRYSSGTSPWGHPTGNEFFAQRHDDKIMEVLAFSLNQLGMLFVGGHGERLCQCRSAVITTTRTFPVQIDGEPCKLNPSIIRLEFHNQANMLYKSKRRSSMLPESQISHEQIKIRVNVIQIQNFTAFNGLKEALCVNSTPLLVTVVMNQSTLDTVRSCLLLIMNEDERPNHALSEKWVFLDASGNDKFYEVDKNQENALVVSDVISNDREVYILDMADPTLSYGSLRTLHPMSHRDSQSAAFRKRVQSDSGLLSSSGSYSSVSRSDQPEDFKFSGIIEVDDDPTDPTSTLLDVVFEQPEVADADESFGDDDISVTQASVESVDVMKKAHASAENLTGATTSSSSPRSRRQNEARPDSDGSTGSTSSNEYILSDGLNQLRLTPVSSNKRALRPSLSNPPPSERALPAEFDSPATASKTAKTSKTHKRSNTDTDPQKTSGFSCFPGFSNRNQSNNIDGKSSDKNDPASKDLAPHNPADNNVNKSKVEDITSENTTVDWSKVFLDASKRGDLNKMKLSVRNGADLCVRDDEGCTALHHAARFGHDHIGDYLLQLGATKIADSICRDRKQTALHKAAWYARLDMCKKLVEAGASVHAKDYKGMTAVDRARQADCAELIKFLTSVQQSNSKESCRVFHETDL